MPFKSKRDTITSVAKLIGVLCLVTALYLGRDVFIPLALAVLLAFLLSPIVNRIQRLGVSNTLAVIVTAFFTFVFMSITLILVGRELSSLVREIPNYKKELVAKARGLAGLSSGMGDELDELATEVTQAIEGTLQQDKPQPSTSPSRVAEDSTFTEDSKPNLLQNLASKVFVPPSQAVARVHDGSSPDSAIYTIPVATNSSPLSWASTVGSILGPLGTVGLVSVFVLFLLIYREDMRDRMIKVLSRGNYVNTTDALQEVSQRISKYLNAQFIMNVSYGITMSLGLMVIGMTLAPDGQFPNYTLWGVLAGLLRFVPYLGPIVAAAFPTLISMAVFPGYSVTIAVVCFIVAVELLSNNIIEPWLYSTSSGISAIAVILAAVFWGWLWGPIGLLLSTPLTVCLVVLGQYVPRFRVFSTLLGESSDIAPWQRYYQRLLSNDDQKATEFLALQIDANGGTTTVDRILIPTLRRMRADYEVHEQLTPEQSSELMSSIAASVDEVTWSNNNQETSTQTAADTSSAGPEATVLPADPPSLRVAGCASHHPAEEVLLSALKNAEPNLNINVIDSNPLPDDIATAAVETAPAAILIMLLPTGGFSQARFLCRAIRKQEYTGPIIVCCCGKFRHFDRLFAQFRKSGANFVTTSVAQTAVKLKSMATNRSSTNPEIERQLAS